MKQTRADGSTVSSPRFVRVVQIGVSAALFSAALDATARRKVELRWKVAAKLQHLSFYASCGMSIKFTGV